MQAHDNYPRDNQETGNHAITMLAVT